MKLAIIGCGNLGTSILKGVQSNSDIQHIWATKRNTDSIRQFESEKVSITSNNVKACENASHIVLGLKPYNILPILQEICAQVDLSGKTIISLATGVTTTTIAEVVGANNIIYRAMPNIAASVNESVTCICGLNNTPSTNREVDLIFQSIGKQFYIDEANMDAATVLGACGTAFVLRFVRAMTQAGIEIGFDAQTAGKIVEQTVLGAAKLMGQTGLHPEELIDQVTTPKGCTIAGLNDMEHNGFSSALIKGINGSFKALQD